MLIKYKIKYKNNIFRLISSFKRHSFQFLFKWSKIAYISNVMG